MFTLEFESILQTSAFSLQYSLEQILENNTKSNQNKNHWEAPRTANVPMQKFTHLISTLDSGITGGGEHFRD